MGQQLTGLRDEPTLCSPAAVDGATAGLSVIRLFLCAYALPDDIRPEDYL